MNKTENKLVTFASTTSCISHNFSWQCGQRTLGFNVSFEISGYFVQAYLSTYYFYWNEIGASESVTILLTLCLGNLFRYNGYFVDLFVRASNIPAITMYQKVRQHLYHLNFQWLVYRKRSKSWCNWISAMNLLMCGS